jgi:endonuclease-3
MNKKEKALEIYKRLLADNPKPRVELDFKTSWELLVSVILSAQATDKLVNTVTPALFAAFPTVQDVAQADAADIDKYVAKVNFHFNKAKNIVASAKEIVEKHNGQVPKTMEELDALPGVARKTANVVLGSAYGITSGIVIDTHGIRLTNKLGLCSSKDPVKIEAELMELLPKETWVNFGQLITLHGRHKCVARPHECDNCPLGDLCPEYKA